ncbi:hypothetical protein V6R86_11255 [Sphingomonas kaistensis]|uniref:Lipoprotein n=1 Tax=Sphingomonas kaistensis TaxID=298708 RepID=A0ABZ2G3U8_9SPHN
MNKIVALTPLLLLAACKAEVREPAAGDETVQMRADADGRVAFNLPFAKGEIKLPTGIMSNANFDIDGVKMMPGATLTGFNLDAGDGKPGKVNFTFTAPASPAEVQTYFIDQFKAQGIEAALAADALQGKTKDGATFVMRFAPQGSGTSGTILLDERS